MNKTLFGAAALFVLSACGQEPATEVETEAAPVLHSGIDTSDIDPTIRPGDDFYAYLNGEWVEEFELWHLYDAARQVTGRRQGHHRDGGNR